MTTCRNQCRIDRSCRIGNRRKVYKEMRRREERRHEVTESEEEQSTARQQGNGKGKDKGVRTVLTPHVSHGVPLEVGADTDPQYEHLTLGDPLYMGFKVKQSRLNDTMS